RAWETWFLRVRGVPLARRELKVVEAPAPDGGSGDARSADEAAPEEQVGTGWSGAESLRTKDFASMTTEELAALRAAMERHAALRPMRRSRRLRAHPRGDMIDLRRMLRSSIATGGDPAERDFRRRKTVPRKLVLICDVSGSMEAYSRALLLFVHAVV